MSNLTATFNLNLSYINSFSSPAQLSPPATVSCKYAAQNEAAIDVPDAAANATVYTVPFGSVTDCSGFIIRNMTANGVNPGVDLAVSLNTGTPKFTLPPGGMMVYCIPTPVTGDLTTPLTAITLTVENGPQVGAGTIGCFVFGDAV